VNPAEIAEDPYYDDDQENEESEESGFSLPDGGLEVASALVAPDGGDVTIEDLASTIFTDRRFPARLALERVRQAHLRTPVRVLRRPRRRERRPAGRQRTRARARSPGRRSSSDEDHLDDASRRAA
jgi:hypothetical protein